ncbi:MAG: nucleoside hydrolase [Luteitalea sp.]|nr:nucleoside hydrolase [Luteitalea sp.]
MRALTFVTVLVLAATTAHIGLAAPRSGKIRVILDTDANNELDDQHAIAYLLLNADVFDVEGITVNRTQSGGGIDEHYGEAVRMVNLCARHPEVKVYRGADKAFNDIKSRVGRPDFDGADAVRFIIERARARDDRRLVLLAVGKLTNVALALAKAPDIAPRVRIVWLGSNYPEPGEYNQLNDEPSLQYILDTRADFEIAVVRYDQPSGTDAVRVTLAEIQRNMPGKGPRVDPPVRGRHGGAFSNFGDYSVNLFEHIELAGTPPSRALYDMAAAAIVKNPAWASRVTIPAPLLKDGSWVDRPKNRRTIVLWEHFDRGSIIKDFYETVARD